ncbi:hypothetical protein CV102_14105 [Natronococcus pandeyae]|uniref:DUF8163 domain-containing protein n=1 Tax=Natronococcus pandeyae TaxID=2055836 RepID=A0A8J8Q1S8_9EURY|nr:hypothetical protein [Natronococcus pandeyae]TYL37861.1 hypothetical protein CV102_14105 [Natronococcus pandeyae]
MTDGESATGGRVESLLLNRGQADSRRLTGVAALAFVAMFGLAAGPLGVAAGITTALVWVAVGTPYAIAVGHVLIVVLYPAGIDPVSIVIVELGFLVLLLTAAVRASTPGRVVGWTIGAAAGLGGVAWFGVRSQSLWLAAALTTGGLALASYGVYRYELVTLGLVDDSKSTHDTTENL